MLGGVVGQDQTGRDLLLVLARDGVITRNVMTAPNIRTTVKTRILAERQQVVRVDWDDHLDLPRNRLKELCRQLSEAVREVNGVIITDYAKGMVRQEVVDAVLSVAHARHIPVALDPKINPDLNVEGITVATPNRKEAFALAHIPETIPADNPLEDEPLLKVAQTLLARWKPSFLIITLGSQGMLLVQKDRRPEHVPTVAREVFDVSGAGDTVIATALLALAAGASHDQAAELANCAAGVVVGKIGTASCTDKELLLYLHMLHQTGMDVIKR